MVAIYGHPFLDFLSGQVLYLPNLFLQVIETCLISQYACISIPIISPIVDTSYKID